MKITKLETIMVKPRTMFLKMHTDEGIIGYGEPLLEGHSHIVDAAIKDFGKYYLLGKDPRNINYHWQLMYHGGFYRGGPILLSAISGIEQAMWDILGKYSNMPVYQLLGGSCRNKLKVYSHAQGPSLLDYTESAKQKVSQGFNALKIVFPEPMKIVENKKYIDKCVSIMETVRKSVGSSVDIAVDFHGRYSPGMAKLLIKELEPYNPFFIEEPCLPENIDVLVDIKKTTHIPIATGERLFSKWGFREILEKQAAFILQPDVSHAGGIAEVRNIAAMAEVYYSPMAPHCPLGPIALAASFQVDASIPNFLIQETVTEGLGEGYLQEPFKIIDGYIDIPKKPGLGIELNEEFINENIYPGDSITPRIFREDGSFGNW